MRGLHEYQHHVAVVREVIFGKLARLAQDALRQPESCDGPPCSRRRPGNAFDTKSIPSSTTQGSPPETISASPRINESPCARQTGDHGSVSSPITSTNPGSEGTSAAALSGSANESASAGDTGKRQQQRADQHRGGIDHLEADTQTGSAGQLLLFNEQYVVKPPRSSIEFGWHTASVESPSASELLRNHHTA